MTNQTAPVDTDEEVFPQTYRVTNKQSYAIGRGGWAFRPNQPRVVTVNTKKQLLEIRAAKSLTMEAVSARTAGEVAMDNLDGLEDVQLIALAREQGLSVSVNATHEELVTALLTANAPSPPDPLAGGTAKDRTSALTDGDDDEDETDPDGVSDDDTSDEPDYSDRAYLETLSKAKLRQIVADNEIEGVPASANRTILIEAIASQDWEEADDEDEANEAKG